MPAKKGDVEGGVRDILEQHARDHKWAYGRTAMSRDIQHHGAMDISTDEPDGPPHREETEPK